MTRNMRQGNGNRRLHFADVHLKTDHNETTVYPSASEWSYWHYPAVCKYLGVYYKGSQCDHKTTKVLISKIGCHWHVINH